MEAPEKIYVHVKKDKVTNTWNSTWIGVHDVEYTRTDAFIEKVRGWLKDCFTFTDLNGKTSIDKEMYKAAVEDFEKYMKGE